MQVNTDDGRTETKRHDDQIEGELIEGDRIDKRLVARTLGQLGERINPSLPGQDDEPETELVALTQIDSMDDTHTAVLYRPETGRFVRASRHDSQSAWTQQEVDWTVRDAGSEIETSDHALESSPDDVEDEARYVGEWAEICLGELAYDADNDRSASIRDELKLSSGAKLHLRDYDGREAFCAVNFRDEA